MSGEGAKAVFLSYASQDAEAARRIAETLRASGVEVWFDADGGLEHGDEWDAKIRKQVKECVLFIAVISANTQAREEGYFRIEWDMAAERARGIASGVAFILPVVIDGTREPDALVPDRFRMVQWTKLPDGVVPPDVQARFLKLWSHRTGVLKQMSRERGAESEEPEGRAQKSDDRKQNMPRVQSAGLRYALVAFAVLVLAAVLYLALKPRRSPEEIAKLIASAQALGVQIAEKSAAATPPSEAKQLVAKAWEQMNKAELARAELEVADGLSKRATEFDPNDTDAWAAWSQVDSWYYYHNLDDSSARREGARIKAARALQLAPRSYEARLAQACYLVRSSGGLGNASMFDQEAAGILTALLRENPDEPRALLIQGIMHRNNGRLVEALASFSRLARNPAFAALAWNETGWANLLAGEFRAAEAAADQSIALQPYWGNLGLKILLAEEWQGDLDVAKSMQERIPAAVRQEDYGVAQACQLYWLRREPANMLRVLDAVPRDWLHANNFDGPRAFWAALAQEMAGRNDLARLQWQVALNQVERRLADQPDSPVFLKWKGQFLASLGHRPEAEKIMQMAGGLGAGEGKYRAGIVQAINHVLLGQDEAAISVLEQEPQRKGALFLAAFCRLYPTIDPLRTNPRFQALQARLDADPRTNPKAKPITPSPISQIPTPSDRPVVDLKSVAVLAFANLSDDKDNEYFSDGISEELLNVLAKIPDLKVSARTSAFYFKGKQVPMAEIARQLGVAYVVEGSVRKQGDRVRITAQLIKAADGFHVWSDTFTRDLKDIFAVQDEIAGLIARNLQLKLSISSERVTVNPEIYELLLQARALAQRQSTEGRKQAIALYRRALAADPRLVVAWAEMAHAYVALGRFGGLPIDEGMREARAAAQRALALNPDQPVGLSALALVQRTADWDWRGAQRSFQRAMELAPGDPGIMSDTAVLYFNVGRVEEAIALARQAVARDPLNVSAQFYFGALLEISGRFEESLGPLVKAVELAPAADEYHSHVARTLMSLGRLADAEKMIELEPNEAYRLVVRAQLRHAQGDQLGATKILSELIAKYGAEMPGYIAMTCALLGDKEQAFAWFDRALARRDAAVVWAKTNYYVNSLHGDPRWNEFLTKLGLADEQLK